VNLAGDYTLTITADPACSAFPPAARSRTYQATLTPSRYASNAYDVVLSGARFYPDDNTMFARVAGDFASFDIDPYSNEVVTEELTAATALTFWGVASGTVGGPSSSAPLRGTLEYCADALGHQGTFPYIRCGVPPVDCESSNHTLALTRRRPGAQPSEVP
jgi:hypothetical protein